MKLQYQNSRGDWNNCDEREEEFLQLCEKHNDYINNGMTRKEVISSLESGIELRKDSSNWYGVCRDGEFFERRDKKRKEAYLASRDYPEGRKLDCGCIVHFNNEIMSSSTGSSCDDCYDDMSN